MKIPPNPPFIIVPYGNEGDLVIMLMNPLKGEEDNEPFLLTSPFETIAKWRCNGKLGEQKLIGFIADDLHILLNKIFGQ